MPENTPGHSIPYPSPSDPIRGSTSDYILTDLRDLALGTDSAITTAVGTRAPLSHTHTQAQISGLSAALASAGETAQWGSVSGKPSAYPPSAHSHAVSDVTGLDARLAALERDTGWRDITGLLENGWLADQVRIRRIGPNVYFSHSGLDGRSRTGNTLVTLPAEFAPRRALIPFTHLDGVFRALVNGFGGVEPPSAIRDSAPYTYASAETMWGVPGAAWPSTLPGDPA